MSSQAEYALIVTYILEFAVVEFMTRHYQTNVCDRVTANDAWLEVLMFISLAAATQPIVLLGSNALHNWFTPV